MIKGQRNSTLTLTALGAGKLKRKWKTPGGGQDETLCDMYNEAQPQLQPQRERELRQTQFLYSQLHPAWRRGCDWRTGGRGDTHKITQPLLHKSFPYWNDWLREKHGSRKAMDEEAPAVQNNTGKPVLRCHEDWDTGAGAFARQRPVRRMR